MRRAMGVAVFSGMIGVTVFGLFLTPVFYVVLEKLSARRAAKAVANPGAGHHGQNGAGLPADGNVAALAVVNK
jgi:hypothetical protein